MVVQAHTRIGPTPWGLPSVESKHPGLSQPPVAPRPGWQVPRTRLRTAPEASLGVLCARGRLDLGSNVPDPGVMPLDPLAAARRDRQPSKCGASYPPVSVGIFVAPECPFLSIERVRPDATLSRLPEFDWMGS